MSSWAYTRAPVRLRILAPDAGESRRVAAWDKGDRGDDWAYASHTPVGVAAAGACGRIWTWLLCKAGERHVPRIDKLWGNSASCWRTSVPSRPRFSRGCVHTVDDNALYIAFQYAAVMTSISITRQVHASTGKIFHLVAACVSLGRKNPVGKSRPKVAKSDKPDKCGLEAGERRGHGQSLPGTSCQCCTYLATRDWRGVTRQSSSSIQEPSSLIRALDLETKAMGG